MREMRTSRGLSQADLGEALNVSRQTVIAIERGRFMPSLPLAIALARFFSTTVEELFVTEGKEPSPGGEVAARRAGRPRRPGRTRADDAW